MHGFKNPVAAQAEKGGGHLAALSWQNLWLSYWGGLSMGTLCNKSLVCWNWIIRACKIFKLCGGLIKKKKKTKLQVFWKLKSKYSRPVFLTLWHSMKKCACVFFLCLFVCFVLRKVSEKWGKQETQRCPCSLAKALGGHLEMLLAVGRQMGTELCRLVLCMHVLVCGIQLGAISWCVRISQTNLELSNAFFPEEIFVLSDVNIH